MQAAPCTRRALLLLLIACLAVSALAAEKPKVRAITAFVRLDRDHYQHQVQETLTMLRAAKAEFERGGFEVQSIRITTQPFPQYVRGLSREDSIRLLRDYDALATKEGFDTAIGPAMLRDDDDPHWAALLAEVLSAAKTLEGSVVVAGEDGIHWKAIRAAANAIDYMASHSPRSQANFNFSATAMLPEYAPFYPGSYHLGEGHRFAVGLQSANVVAAVFAQNHAPETAGPALESALSAQARAIEEIAQHVEKSTGWMYMGLDLSPAPLKDVSIGQTLENFNGQPVGSPGTMTAAAVITGALKAIPVKHAGYSGLMLPVLEDGVLADRWSEGRLTLDSLLAYSAVCGTGLDVVPLPGDIGEERLMRIVGDMASLAVKWHKPLSARLLPVAGKRPGQRTEFEDPFLVNALIQPVR